MSNNRYKILIVEDDRHIASLLSNLAEAGGYQALCAKNCAEGLLMFSSHLPDLVLLDLGLPDQDGSEIIRSVRERSGVPIIVLSARSDEQEKVAVTYRLKMLIRAAVEATLDYEQYGNPAEVSVTFTDNEKIRTLNKKFRGIDRSTDVLSFPLFDYTGEQEEPPVDEFIGMLGDIVISLEQAEKQAAEYGHSFEREAAFLAVHSMLHLLGYDHESGEEDEADMRRRQSEILEKMGLGIEK